MATDTIGSKLLGLLLFSKEYHDKNRTYLCSSCSSSGGSSSSYERVVVTRAL